MTHPGGRQERQASRRGRRNGRVASHFECCQKSLPGAAGKPQTQKAPQCGAFSRGTVAAYASTSSLYASTGMQAHMTFLSP